MDKIPVAATIGGAYRFAFARFFGNLGVVWVPAALAMVGAWYFIPVYMTAMTAMTSHMGNPPDPQAMMSGMLQFYRALIVFWLVVLLLRAEIMLGLMRRALGLGTGPSIVYLSIGKSFWRLAGAYLSVAIILLVADIVLSIGLGVAGAVAGIVTALAAGGDKTVTGPIVIAAIGIGVVVLLCALLYIAVRLTFLLTPVVVDEERFDLTKPWKLTRGNFWRIFAIGAAVFVPISILIWLVSVPLYLGALWPYPLFPHVPMGPHDMPAMMADMQKLMTGMLARARAHWFLLVPVMLASSTLIYGIAAGAAASAYRALVPKAHSAV